jgi:hypothetical protein
MESIVGFPEDKGLYTKKAIVIRSLLVFLGYVFVFLAVASELRDILVTFFGIAITPRQALLIISLLQVAVWLFWGFYPFYRDKSFVIVGYILLVLLFVFLLSETEIGLLILGGFTTVFRILGTIFIGLSIIGAGGYTSLSYLARNYEGQ